MTRDEQQWIKLRKPIEGEIEAIGLEQNRLASLAARSSKSYVAVALLYRAIEQQRKLCRLLDHMTAAQESGRTALEWKLTHGGK